MDVLLSVIKLDSKVLPLLIINRDIPDLLARAIQDFEVVLLAARIVDQSAGLELDLVTRVVGRFVPDIEILVRQVEWASGILLHTKVQRLDAFIGRVLRRIGCELKSGAAEPVLLLEDRGIADGHFNRRVVRAIETGGLCSGELEDLRPGEVVALDVVGIEEGVGSVEDGGGFGEVGGDAAFEDDGAFHVVGGCAQGDVRVERRSRQGERGC